MYQITIPGAPMGKQRPRHGKGFTYTPKETVNYENLVKTIFIQKYGQPMSDKEIAVGINAFFEIPKSTSNKKRALMLDYYVSPTKKPDLDNIMKIICDSLNGIAYKDDSQIVAVVLEKHYSETPRVEISISEVELC